MIFRIKVMNPETREQWWETMNRAVGERRRVRGYPDPPKFTGDINLFGMELIKWFNDTRKDGVPPREFVTAELLED